MFCALVSVIWICPVFGVRGDWIGDVCLLFWCYGEIVVCAWWPGIFYRGSVLWRSGWFCVGVVSYFDGCARSVWCGVLWALL